MKKVRILGIVLTSLALLTLGGCLRSIHPLYTEETLIFEPKLLGKWSEPDSEEYWLFEKGNDEKEYQVTIHDPDEEAPAILSGHLAKVGEDLYLDLYLEDAEVKGGDFVKLHLFPVHSFMRIQQIRPTLQMTMVNIDTVNKMLSADPKALKHELIDDTPIITAGPEELQKFFVAHRSTEKMFGDYSDLKPSAPEAPGKGETPAPKKAEPKSK